MNQKPFALVFCLVVCLSLSSAIHAQGNQGPPIFEGLGDQHHPISTDSDLVQQYFDQGLILSFGFNHGEAHRSFFHAARLDPDCAMCWWGAAWVLGPNINAEMEADHVPKAWELLQQAQRAADSATPREQAYIAALAKRYGPPVRDDRSERDQAFAEAMGEVAGSFPDDLDAQVIYAESLMDTTPWDYWLEGDQPKPVTKKILSTLQEVLRHAPDHPMANHLLIHAVEAARPLQGLEEAKRLEDLVPGAGHLVHMPAHIYIRLGLYHEATLANVRAIEADQRYLGQVDASGNYWLAYVPHNYHFGWATATFEGRSQLAIRLAREMSDMIDQESMRERSLTTLQDYWITPLYSLVRFGHWHEILDWPEPAEDLVYPRAVWHYARGMAFTRQGDLEAARNALKMLNALRTDSRIQWVTLWDINTGRHILDIASHTLEGELALAAGDFEQAITSLERALEREEALNYDEPPPWHSPIRQTLGVVLLEAGQPGRAETIYREDLAALPENGWSLFGLLHALRRQGKVQEAREVHRRFLEAWRHADVVLTGSRF